MCTYCVQLCLKNSNCFGGQGGGTKRERERENPCFTQRALFLLPAEDGFLELLQNSCCARGILLYVREKKEKRADEGASEGERRRGWLERVIETGLVPVSLPVYAAEAGLAFGPLVKQQCSRWVRDTAKRV